MNDTYHEQESRKDRRTLTLRSEIHTPGEYLPKAPKGLTAEKFVRDRMERKGEVLGSVSGLPLLNNRRSLVQATGQPSMNFSSYISLPIFSEEYIVSGV